MDESKARDVVLKRIAERMQEWEKLNRTFLAMLQYIPTKTPEAILLEWPCHTDSVH